MVVPGLSSYLFFYDFDRTSQLQAHRKYSVELGCPGDRCVECFAEVEPKMPLRLLKLRLEQFDILVVRSCVYRVLTRQVITVDVTSLRISRVPRRMFAECDERV